MKTNTDALIFHMAFDLELHTYTNKNYFIHGTTYNVLVSFDCFYYYNICCFRAVNNAPSQIQRNLFMLGNSPYKLDECSGYWSLLYVKVTIWVFKLIKVHSEHNTCSGVMNTCVQSQAFHLRKDWFYYSIWNSKVTSLS